MVELTQKFEEVAMTQYRDSLLEIIDILTCALESTEGADLIAVKRMLAECIKELDELQ